MMVKCSLVPRPSPTTRTSVQMYVHVYLHYDNLRCVASVLEHDFPWNYTIMLKWFSSYTSEDF